ncbi:MULTISPECIES: ABC transporter substrate-binding protein [Metabacillus]|uniref:Sugar ABC transporter substrate-binding protein n=2 Tax=Metabacillus TaxID=2675233 RepID=A0A179SKY7_9BACI|nr:MULTISPECIES: sugar ABC transporter substrate-binding protein [Metabacillus]OAS82054.1 sugar ABC transporter substrate-binding protein [Metabacillus litoralis]QNF29720.1 sugar ABC transporter substrate-binding protein [Metabacillus sp. KUDC1714]
MKKFLFLLLSVVMVFSLAACSGSSSSGGSSSGSDSGKGDGEDEKVTLRIAWWGSQPRHDYTLEVIKMYEEQNPNVKIQAEYASWDDYWKKLAPQASAQQLPDIIQMDLSYFSQYAENGQLADLTPFLDKQIDVTNFSDNIIDGGKLGDKLYGFNAGVNVVGFHYDPELLKKVGVDSLDENWTWDDYKELAKKAKDTGVFVDTGMKADVFFNYYLRTLGKSLYSKDGTTLGYDDDQLFVDFFEMTSNMVKDGVVPTPDYLAQLKGIEDDPVVTKDALGIWQWSNQFVGLQQVANRPLGIHPMPGPGTKEGLYLKPSMFWSVANNSKHQEEAAKFIDFFVNDIEANKLILGERGIPGSSAVKEALKPELSPEQVQVFDSVEWAEQNSSEFDGPDPIGAGEVIELLDSLSEQMNYGQLEVKDAAKQFRQQAESILSQNK